MLCAGEVLTVLLIYFLATSRSLVLHQRHFSFTRSLEDVVGISCTRAAILSLSYAIGQRFVHRPYLYVSYLLAALCLPYIVVKTIMFRYGPDGVAAAFLLSIAGLCSIGHVLAARRTVEWARRRYQMGLAGFGMPWEEGEDAWVMLRRPDLEDMTKTSDGGGPDSGEDVPAEMLADDDSKFVELEPGLKVHYKEVAPSAAAGASGLGGPDSATTGIVLVHGFGGGVFAWRHVMEALAMQCHCRVIAFDRPAFGLTARPKATDQNNPYTMASQSQLVLQLCSALGLRQVVLVAHADGCLVALRAAATSANYYQQQGQYLQPVLGLGGQQCGGGGGSRCGAADPMRSAPTSADSSPKFTSGSPGSPGLDQYQGTGQAVSTQGQHGIALGASPNMPAPQRTLSGGSTGPLSAAAFAAAAAAGVESAFPGHQLGAGGGAAPSLPQSTAALDWEREGGRSVVAAADVALRSGNSSVHGGAATAGPGSALASRGGSQHHISLAMPPASHHVLPGGSLNVGSAGSAHMHHPSAAAACCVTLADIESVSGRVDAGSELDRASATSTSITTALATQAHHRRAQSVPGPVGGGQGVCNRSPDGWETCSCGAGPSSSRAPPFVLGLVLLHPNLSGVIGPAFSRILARSKLGRSILRPLLRTEVGEIANRRAWHNTDKLTTEVLELYKTPLRVEGWDAALIETTRQRKDSCQGDLAAYCSSVQPIPTLIATGEHDRIMPPCKTESLASDLPHARLAVLHDCGHLSHEEAPSALLEQLVPFCGEVLCHPPVVMGGALAPFLRT
ncbi:hypothetical protein HYH02_006419 [Chlamydomonas schloesseri]|uniref:AB hydrolase-1 domain-containing protein n=1 Tax=Chlamydomonas schloesseri TaxID=2026947 RepID=A0A835WJ10_9CHLO|nr:hypothetical protein HYH02_006419 [Chlamydomonas schloesseri]|eukprot:KAG2448528.1 hypothetical protein HYH02_006419 [Chlamydomonas schloesseri]